MKKRIQAFDVVNVFLISLITIVIVYPLYFCIIASFSEPNQVALGNTLLWIKDFTLEPYQYVFEEEQIWIGYRNSIIYTFFGTLYNLVLTIPLAYALSKSYLPFRNAVSWYFFLTMYFAGGMIPTYMVIKDLGLVNNPLVMIIGSGVSCYNMIVTRQFFTNSIPNELYEAAFIDGASEMKSFFTIGLPLAKPIIAVMALYYGTSHWNSYYSALLYIRDKAYQPLQLVLRNILMSSEMAMSGMENADADTIAYLVRRAEMAQGMKYAVIFIASAPLLIIYPFIQKHFEKGVMIGAVKG